LLIDGSTRRHYYQKLIHLKAFYKMPWRTTGDIKSGAFTKWADDLAQAGGVGKGQVDLISPDVQLDFFLVSKSV